MKNNLWKLGTFLLAAFIFCGGIYYFFYLRTRPHRTTEKFFTAICDGRIDEAVSYMSSSIPVASEWLKLGLAAGIKECKENGGFSELILGEENIEAEIAIVKGVVAYQKGLKKPVVMKMYREGGQWKIAWQGN